VYALTWFALALMVAGITWWIVREDKRRRARKAGNAHRQESDHAGQD
jgi:surfeit locus 1 family protein